MAALRQLILHVAGHLKFRPSPLTATLSPSAAAGPAKTGPSLIGGAMDPFNTRRALKKFVEMPINVSRTRANAKVESFRSKRNQKYCTNFDNAMPKAVESVSKTSTIPRRSVQFRSISATKVLVLALFFVIAALSVVFLLLQ